MASLIMRKLTTVGALRLLLYGAMAVVSAIFLLRPVNDPDFFWHLKTGEWIWQHGELPVRDPFNFMNQSVPEGAQRFTLTAYWLSQLVYHVIHGLLGMPGIVALKFLTAFLIVVALVRLRRGDPVVHAALILATLPLFYRLFPFDRPQAFSFLLFATLLGLLEKARRSPRVSSAWWSYVPVPLLMLLWANLHGGHLIGQITIALFILLEGVKFLHPVLRPLSRDRYRLVLIAGGAGLVASLVNPNSYHALGIVLAPAATWVGNTEYQSTVTFFRGQPLLAIFWGALALSALMCLFSATRPDITWIALLAGTGYQGFVHVRYVPFFMIAALPALGCSLSVERLKRWGRYPLVAGAVVLAAFSTKGHLPDRELIGLALRVNENLYPVGAADFIVANVTAGNLYNTYFWGGYLLWRLAPERKVFVDGRGLGAQGVFQSHSISVAFENPGGSSPLWKRLLRQNDVGCLIIPRVDAYQGNVFDEAGRLRTALLEAPEWVPVYADAISLVYVLNKPEHSDVIRRHQIPRERLLGWWVNY